MLARAPRLVQLGPRTARADTARRLRRRARVCVCGARSRRSTRDQVSPERTLPQTESPPGFCTTGTMSTKTTTTTTTAPDGTTTTTTVTTTVESSESSTQHFTLQTTGPPASKIALAMRARSASGRAAQWAGGHPVRSASHHESEGRSLHGRVPHVVQRR